MDIIKDIILEIEILYLRLDDLEREYRHLYSLCFPTKTKLTANYSGMPGQSSQPLPLGYAIKSLQKIQESLSEVTALIEGKKELLKAIKERMSKLEGVDHQVVYKRDVEGKSLQEIADELHKSYSLIAKISSKNAKRVKDKVANS